MDAGWAEFFAAEAEKPYHADLARFLAAERAASTVYPGPADVLAAFRHFGPRETRAVIVGQDPYHGPGQANGLAFSVPPGVAIPPSLANIHAELAADLGCERPTHGDLTSWAHQGVLCLNTVLTVRAGEPGSHRGRGWETLTDAVISRVNECDERVVFLLWGADARAKRALVTNRVHAVIESAHPSPLSARRGFLGSRPFSRANELLENALRSSLDWASISAAPR